MFQHVKEYRQKYKLTQIDLAEKLGMNAKFIWSLEKNKPRMSINGARVVYSPQEEVMFKAIFGDSADTAKDPSYFDGLPTITSQDLHSIRKQKHMTQTEAGDVIGISGSQWGQIEAGKSPEDEPHLRRWYTLLVLAHFSEYFQTHTPILTLAHETPVIEAQVLTPAHETAVLEDIADQPGLIPFAYGSQKVRVKWVDGEPWFCLSDICKAINYDNSSNAANLIDEDELQKLVSSDSLGREQLYWFTSEAGMYQFLGSTHTEAAKPFRKWVNKEVLPTIRKTGQYQAPQIQPIDPIDAAILSLQRIKEIEAWQRQQSEKQAQIEAQLSEIAQQVSAVKYLEVSKTDRSEVLEIVQSEVLESKLKEKQEQKIHYRKRKELEKRISDVAWAIVKLHGGNQGEIIKSINKRIKAALRGVYSYAIARERYSDDDFALAYQVVAMVEKEMNDFPKQGEINFDGDAA